MKTPEDEAFDDLAKRQGAWGGGFPAKRQMAMDKINAEFHEEYIKYRTAFPKEYTAPQVQEDRIKYGTSWEKDGERIDPMSVYKEPEAMDEHQTLEALKYAASKGYGRIVRENSAPFTIKESLAQPAQEPSTITFSASNDWVMRITADRRIEVNKDVEVTETAEKVLEAMQWMLKRAQREWVGLTDDEILEATKMSMNSNVLNRKVYEVIEAKLKEKNNGT